MSARIAVLAPGPHGPYRHDCRLPGRWKRWRLHLSPGALVQCRICMRRWLLVKHESFTEFYLEWEIVE